jgi:hypothetical protein
MFPSFGGDFPQQTRLPCEIASSDSKVFEISASFKFAASVPEVS